MRAASLAALVFWLSATPLAAQQLGGSSSTANQLRTNPADCTANQFATSIDAKANLTCAQPSFSNLSGTATDAQIPNNITVDLAAAATVMAADPADCPADQYANASAANGDLSCAAVSYNQLATGTNNTATLTCGTGCVVNTSGSGTIVATSAAALAANPTDCGAGLFATTIAANGNLTCASVGFADLSGVMAVSQMASGTNTTTFTADADNTGGTEPANGAGYKIEGGSGDLAITYDATGNDLEFSGATGGYTFDGTVHASIDGNAATATALAANPSDCSASQFATGIVASGNLACAQPAFSDLASTASAGQIPSGTNTTTWTVDADNTGGSEPANGAGVRIEGGSGDVTETYDATGNDLEFAGAAGGYTFDATVHANIDGNSATATALAANPSDCAGGTFATAIAANGNLTCTAVSGITGLTADSGGTTTGSTVTVAGGTNGIDTVRSSDTVTLNLDTTEIGTTTFGSGSGFTWTFDGGTGTDATLAAAASGAMTATGRWSFTGALSLPGATSLGTCTPNDLKVDTDATTGTRVNLCIATDTWISIDNTFGAEIDATELANTLSFSGSQVLDLNTNAGASLRLPTTGTNPSTTGGIVIDTTDGLQWYTGSAVRTAVDDANTISIAGSKAFTDSVELLDQAGSYTATKYGLTASDTESIAATTGSVIMAELGQTRAFSITANGAIRTLSTVYAAPTITNPSSLGLTGFLFVQPFTDVTAWNLDATAGSNSGFHTSFTSAPTFARAGGSNTNTTTLVQFAASGPSTGAGTSVARTGFAVAEAGTVSGTTLTSQIGVDVAKLTKANSGAIGSNIGIRNASTEVFPPSTQSLAADSDTIVCDSTIKHVSATATRDLTSNPQISDGATGQICIIKNTGANTVKLDDGNGLQTDTNTSFTMGQGDTIAFYYDGTDWMELFRKDL